MASIPEQYYKAGKIAAGVKSAIPSFTVPGASVARVAQRVEAEILQRGGRIAFPCGIGVNYIAAHYSPPPDDGGVLLYRDVVKVDFGVHIDGYLVDVATTLTWNPALKGLLAATQSALGAAIQSARRDRDIGKIGAAAKGVADSLGFKPIANLGGHTIGRYAVHGGRHIPSVPGMKGALQPGDVFALEPFFTLKEGSGKAEETDRKTIFAIRELRKTSDPALDEFAAIVWDERRTLPFTPRWYLKKYDPIELDGMLKDLTKKGVLTAYRTLAEKSRKPVAQFERTLAVADSSVLTLA